MFFKKKKPSVNPAEQLQEDRKYLLTRKQNFYLEEAYKSLRTNVSFAMAGKKDSKIIMVTAAAQGEGKSITSANLAISFAQAGKKTLLIDCDLRRPKQARLFLLQSVAGLSNVLLQPDQLKSALLDTTNENLKIMLSGDVPPNPSELLGSEGMQKLLEELREEFDYIILDTPPVDLVTDAMVLAAFIDGVLFVVRAGRAEINQVKKAVAQMEYAGAKLLGFVLNDMKEHGNRSGYKSKYNYRYGYSYGHGYGYGYGYGYGEKKKRS